MSTRSRCLADCVDTSRWRCLLRRVHGSSNNNSSSSSRDPATGARHGRISLSSQILILTILMFACWQAAQAELVFHRRDHRDQGRNGKSARTHAVRNYGDATQYLQKYGYLETCIRPPRTKRHLPDFLRGVSERLPNCSNGMIVDALKLLQQKFDLAPSGRLDDETRVLMSKGRCGNSDFSEAPTRRKRRDSDFSSDLPVQSSDKPSSRRSHDSMQDLLRQQMTGNHGSRTRRSLSSEEDAVSAAVTDGRFHPEDSTIMDSRNFKGVENSEMEELNLLVIHQASEPESSRLRRQEMLTEISERLQRGKSDAASSQPQPLNLTDDEMTSLMQERQRNRAQRIQRRKRRRRKRTISILSIGEMSEGSAGDKVKFQKDENSPIQWRLLDDGISGKIPLADQRAILELSFRMWSEVIPLKFLEANDVDINNVDVIIAFAKQAHMNCDKPFDGIGGELAHSWTGGDIHFDEDENYKRVDPSGSGIDLLKVAVHEVGHVLGLLHNDKIHSIMYPIYVNPPDMHDDFELSWDDRKAVQKIYGVCKGSFNLVFDWLRKVRSTGEPNHHRPRYIFNTYFFRSNRYWMYENRFNRTRFGDPLYISRGWTGIEGPVDAYVQVITSTGQEYSIDTYFFVGDSYYKYNDEADHVEEGYPRKISSDFGPASSGNESIPSDLDAVLFDNRDSLLYFFKGDWVWIYDPQQIGRNACCEGKRLFSELYPMDDTVGPDDLLHGDLDTAFYSYHHHTMFFFKGETVYENTAYNEKTPGINRLRRLGDWYQFWFDICDVE